MVRDKFLIAAVIGFMTLLASSHVFAQAEVIEKRQDAMKGNSANAKAIKAAIESKDYATIETKAKDIMGTAEKIPGLFPKGSDDGKNQGYGRDLGKVRRFCQSGQESRKGSERAGCGG